MELRRLIICLHYSAGMFFMMPTCVHLNSLIFCLTFVPSTIPQPAVVGINRLWVSSSCRRMGVASKLLDTVR